MSARRALERPRLAPLQVEAVEAGADALAVKLVHATPFTRVHVFGTRYLPAYDVFGALGTFDFTDVTPAAKLPLEWDTTYTCALSSGLVYTVKLAKKDDKYYAQVSAAGPNAQRVINKDASEAEMKKKELPTGLSVARSQLAKR